MIHLLLRAGALALVCLSAPIAAQTAKFGSPNGWSQVQGPCVTQPDGKTCTAVSATNPLPVTGTAGQPLPVETIVRSPATDRGAIVGTTAVTLMAANAARRWFSIQIQSASATCSWSSLGAATLDFHSLQLVGGSYYVSEPTHVATGAISIICNAASTPIYAREG